jgi:hypothetical protein
MNILYMIGNGFDIHIGLVYLAITYLGSVHCFCGLKILILNGSGLQIQTIGKVANPDQRLAAEHPLQQKFRVTYY